MASESKLLDRNAINLQITEAKATTVELRILASGRNSPEVFDLRCEISEKVIDYLQREHPYALPPCACGTILARHIAARHTRPCKQGYQQRRNQSQ